MSRELVEHTPLRAKILCRGAHAVIGCGRRKPRDAAGDRKTVTAAPARELSAHDLLAIVFGIEEFEIGDARRTREQIQQPRSHRGVGRAAPRSHTACTSAAGAISTT